MAAMHISGRELRRVVIAAAVFQAFYGMAETFSGAEKIFGYQKKYNIGSVTGTYVNRNHFAGYMLLGLPVALGLLADAWRAYAITSELVRVAPAPITSR